MQLIKTNYNIVITLRLIMQELFFQITKTNWRQFVKSNNYYLHSSLLIKKCIVCMSSEICSFGFQNIFSNYSERKGLLL